MNKLLLLTVASLALMAFCQVQAGPTEPVGHDNDEFEGEDETWPVEGDDEIFYDANDGEGDDEFSQISVVPSDDEEIKWLSPEHRIFSDYCIKSRNVIFKYVQDTTNDGASMVFRNMFDTVGDIVAEMMSVQKDAVDQGSKLIKEEIPVDELTGKPKPGEAQEQLDKSIEKVAPLQTRTSTAISHVIRLVVTVAQTAVFQRLNNMRTRFTADTIKEITDELCDQIKFKLSKKVEEQFSKSKDEITKETKKSDIQGQDLLVLLKKTKPDSVNCMTSSRVKKLVNFCNLLGVIGPSIWPMIGVEA